MSPLFRSEIEVSMSFLSVYLFRKTSKQQRGTSLVVFVSLDMVDYYLEGFKLIGFASFPVIFARFPGSLVFKLGVLSSKYQRSMN